MASSTEKALVPDCDTVTFVLSSSTEGQSSQFTAINQSERRLAVKVKCSNNDIYRINPIYSICEPLPGALNVDVYRLPGGTPKADKLVLQYVDIGADETDPKGAFAQPPATGFEEIRLILNAVETQLEETSAEADLDKQKDGD